MRNVHGGSRGGGSLTYRGRRTAALILGSAAGVLAFERPTQATDYTWVGVTNTWDNTATNAQNWSSGGVTPATYSSTATSVAHFGSTGQTVVSVHANLKAQSISFENAPENFTINNDTFTLTTTGAITLQASAATGGTGAVETFNSAMTVSTAGTSASYNFVDNDTDSGSHLVIGGPISASATGGVTTLNLSGTGAGSNLFSGAMTNSMGVVAVDEFATNGSWQLSGPNTYTGTTVVNSQSITSPSTLIISGVTNANVLGATAITVGSAAGSGTLTPGSGILRTLGNPTIGTATAGSLILAGGDGATVGMGTLDMTNGGTSATTHTLTLNNATAGATVMTIGSASAPSALDFDVSAASADEVLMSGTLSIGAGGGIVNLTVLATPTGTSPYTLISTGGITGSGSLVFSNLSTTYTTGGETYTLYESGNSEDLGFAPASSAPEPTTVSIVIFGAGIAMLKRRRSAVQLTTARTV